MIRKLSDTKRNAIALYANFIMLAAAGLVTNPLQVRFLGLEAFGVWKACLRILDLTSVADGRATQALKWIIAHKASNEDTEQKRRDVGAAIAIWLIWLPFLIAAIGTVVLVLPLLIKNIPVEQLRVARVATCLLGINVIFTAILGIPDAVLAGTNQGYRSYIVTTILLVVSNVAMVCAAYVGWGIVGMGFATLTGSLITGCITFFTARRHVGWFGARRPSWSDVKRILGFSNWTLIWSMAQALMLSTEILLISSLAGPALVGRYTFTAYAAQFALSICLMTGSAITPRLGALIGGDQHAEAARLHSLSQEVLMTLLAVAGSGLVLCNRSFVTLWVGSDFYLGDVENLAMIGVLIQLAFLRFDAQVQDVGLAIGAKVGWGSAGALLALLLGGALYRLTGSLVAMFCGILLGRLPLNAIFPLQVRSLIPAVSGRRKGAAGVLLVITSSFVLSRYWQPTGWLGLLVAGTAAAGLSLAGSLLLILTPTGRQSLLSGLGLSRTGSAPPT